MNSTLDPLLDAEHYLKPKRYPRSMPVANYSGHLVKHQGKYFEVAEVLKPGDRPNPSATNHRFEKGQRRGTVGGRYPEYSLVLRPIFLKGHVLGPVRGSGWRWAPLSTISYCADHRGVEAIQTGDFSWFKAQEALGIREDRPGREVFSWGDTVSWERPVDLAERGKKRETKIFTGTVLEHCVAGTPLGDTAWYKNWKRHQDWLRSPRRRAGQTYTGDFPLQPGFQIASYLYRQLVHPWYLVRSDKDNQVYMVSASRIRKLAKGQHRVHSDPPALLASYAKTALALSEGVESPKTYGRAAPGQRNPWQVFPQ